jgi:hypothetical protein
MYKFDENTLEFIKVKWHKSYLKLIGGYLVLLFFVFGGVPLLKYAETEHEIKIIMADRNKFTQEKLIEAIKGLNFPFPYIVMAQAIHETNMFQSALFLENNNLFGSKCATHRITLTKLSNNSYAYFTTWKESVYDYALYSATYLSKIQTEEEYYDYLSQNYAEDPQYVNKLKQLVVQYNLKNLMK